MGVLELLAPSGDLERLKIACLYGADAVYIGGQDYSLRANALNFSLSDIEEAVKKVTVGIEKHSRVVSDKDKIEVNGVVLKKQKHEYYLFHKPVHKLRLLRLQSETRSEES